METGIQITEHLRKTYRGAFPFSIECPSWVYPADILPNVSELAQYVDSIELILFESGREFDLPGDDVFKKLRDLSESTGLAYTVHLPLDRCLGSSDREEYEQSIEAVSLYIKASLQLDPELYYLHLDSRGYEDGPEEWKQKCSLALERILKQTGAAPGSICIENLEYPFDRIEDIVSGHNVSICMDAGHLMEYAFDIDEFYGRYRERIKGIHLHALDNGKPHGPLTGLDKRDMSVLKNILEEFTGTVTLEVFSFEYLKQSLQVLEGLLQEDN